MERAQVSHCSEYRMIWKSTSAILGRDEEWANLGWHWQSSTKARMHGERVTAPFVSSVRRGGAVVSNQYLDAEHECEMGGGMKRGAHLV